ncbi:hypothetical protein C3L33_21874, partial [Rhododendron williamsianum]
MDGFNKEMKTSIDKHDIGGFGEEDEKLKQILQDRISAMPMEDLGAVKDERQLVDSLWNACFDEPSSLREKGLLPFYQSNDKIATYLQVLGDTLVFSNVRLNQIGLSICKKLKLKTNESPQGSLGAAGMRDTGKWIIAYKGNWRNDKPEVTPSFIFNSTYVNNRDEVYTFYTLINVSNVAIVFVDELGSLKMVTWVGRWVEFYSLPKDQCDDYSWCGVYGYCDSNNGREFECTCLPGYEPRSAEEWYLRDASGGCIKKREALSMCRNGEGFVKVANTKIPDTSKAHVQISLSVHDCEAECLRNCSCLAFTSEAEGRARANCFTWHENLMDVRRFPNGGLDLYVRVDAVELGPESPLKCMECLE